MPSYVVEFDSNHGPERRLFTLDDDRTLEVQLYQVLEELRQSGRILHGAAGDELAVSWNGRELAMREPLAALGIDATRPLVLRMRPKPVLVETVAIVRPRYTLRHMLLPPIEGALGALAAWGLTGLLTDLGGSIDTVARADLIVAVALGGLVGMALGLGSVVRGLARLPAVLLCGVGSAVAGGLVLAATAIHPVVPSAREFLLARIIAWLLVAVPVALIATAPLRELGGQRFLEASVVALGAAMTSALVASLPGVSDLWAALAFTLCGAMVGAAAISIPVWRVASHSPVVPATAPRSAQSVRVA